MKPTPILPEPPSPPGDARRLYTAEQSRAVDRYAIEILGIPGERLMARAARAAFACLLREHAQPQCLQVLCGPGNNGGDGLLLAVLAAGRGIPVRVFLVGGEPRSPDACLAAARARGAGLVLEPFTADLLESRGVVVDAMLGTGVRGALRREYAEAVAAVNGLGLPVLALDVPTGVDADTGAVAAQAVRARWTVSFITAKRGLYTGSGPAHAGARSVAGLDVPAEAFELADAFWSTLDLAEERRALAPRSGGVHKGDFGRCLVVGGDHGMGGAVLLAAEAALRCGTGLCRVATRGEHLAPLLARRPECMVTAVEHRGDLEAQLPWATAIVVGPGLGQGPWAEQLLGLCLEAGKPLLVDADALNLLARWRRWPLPPGSVITPHPGEAGRLLDTSTGEVQADRFAAAEALAARTGAAVVLKGQGSLVLAGGSRALCLAGNAGMASGGMGDVLSGVIGALLAQGL
ncbi:MAG: NAD(P)H-hydrate dehydratase, partial [Halieaceae bacterium]|nr:NAD(P)H-hydrate dehydratase [Halieaceae bacterium]